MRYMFLVLVLCSCGVREPVLANGGHLPMGWDIIFCTTKQLHDMFPNHKHAVAMTSYKNKTIYYTAPEWALENPKILKLLIDQTANTHHELMHLIEDELPDIWQRAAMFDAPQYRVITEEQLAK